ncbi:putative leucine-rich repeat receptor-like serine/threonine-protein kinase [Platanthera zijinensis]|uniref:Leucine-rich repeat receptor-like serine/threonine-protein kinase n=1 Tax=Platanthera zijinensis TaxID=2320716 RepID=A0AAP0AW59_9ASPA
MKLYSYEDLRIITTEDFSPVNKVDNRGFEPVYKGTLVNGIKVAIKVLSSESTQGAKDFLSEIAAISNIVHENLVKLYGACIEGDYRILVYNYLENNSLAQTLLFPQ